MKNRAGLAAITSLVLLCACSPSTRAGIDSHSTSTAPVLASAVSSPPIPVTPGTVTTSETSTEISTYTQPDVTNSVTGWVHTDAGAAAFIGWTVAGATVTGTYSSAILSSGTMKTENYSYSGVIDGATLTLTFTAGFGGIAISGQVGDDTLTLSFPRNDGTLAPVTFHPGATTDYNTAVSALQHTAAGIVAASQSSASAAAQAAQNQADIAAADTAVDTAAKQLAASAGSLVEDTAAVNDAISAVNTDLGQQRDALAKVQQESAAVIEAAKTVAPGDSDNCYAASTAAYDASDVDYQGQKISGDLATYAADALQTDLDNLDGARQALLSARSAAPDYETTIEVPTETEMSTAEATAQKALSAWSTITTTAPATAATVTTQATEAAESASARAGC